MELAEKCVRISLNWAAAGRRISERGMSVKVVIGVGVAIFGGDVDFRKSKTQIWRNMDRIGNLDRNIIVVLRLVTVTTTQ